MPSGLVSAFHSSLKTGAIRAVSFDVFDTFLLRRCVSPQGVFERAAFHAPIATGRPGVVDSYVQHRRLAESKAHKDAKDLTGSPEIPIADVYSRFPSRLFGLDLSGLAQLSEAEFQAELDLCFANPQVGALYAEAGRLGLKRGFISDTYWSAEQLSVLLRSCAPGLHWDFLYASCDHGTGKSDKLFARLLADQELDGRDVLHVGDNPVADVKGARKFGIDVIHVPQASDRLASVLQREDAALRLLGNGADKRLDGGLCAVRRLIAANECGGSDAFQLGVEVVGPIMTAFDRFIADRVSRIASHGGRTAVLFLARDGMLPFDIWQASRQDSAHYVEINRRVALIGSAATVKPLTKIIRHFPALDEHTVAEMLKIRTPRLSAFFRECPGGRCTGEVFAEALHDLIDTDEIAALASETRLGMLAYLRTMVPELDTLTDVVLIDIGYAGSIQKSLRQIFDLEGIAANIHGLYLLTFDDGFVDLADADTAEGLISDLVMPPRVNRMIARNMTIMEHACCAPQGSVLGYRDGVVVREADPRPSDQLAMCTEIQAGALTFAAQARTLVAACGVDPFADLDLAAGRVAALLARLLLLPTDAERTLLGGMRHDVNWGTQTLVPTADAAAAGRFNVAWALPTLYTAPEPPMWLAGTMASLSPVHGFLYALFGAGHLTSDIFADVKHGSIEMKVIAADATRTFSVSWFRTAHGDVRIHIPVPRSFGALALSLPLGAIAHEGIIVGVTVQNGSTVAKALADRDVRHLPSNAWSSAGVTFFGGHYRIDRIEDHQLLLRMPVINGKIGLITVLLRPLGGIAAASPTVRQRSPGSDPDLVRRP